MGGSGGSHADAGHLPAAGRGLPGRFAPARRARAAAPVRPGLAGLRSRGRHAVPADAERGELDLNTARFTLTLSPEKHRGFSGEGALLGRLADATATEDADLIGVLLAWDPRIDIGRLSAEAGIEAERTAAALTHLAAAGRVGYDLAEESFFHRELLASPSGHALGEIGHLAVAAGLASAEPYVRIAAAEVWVKACRDGRLDPQLAARAIVTGVTGEAFKLNRVADGLQHASHDPVEAQPAVATVFATADDLIPAKPSDLHLLLGLAARAGTPATVPAAITRLAAGPNRSQLVTAARRLTVSPGGR